LMRSPCQAGRSLYQFIDFSKEYVANGSSQSAMRNKIKIDSVEHESNEKLKYNITSFSMVPKKNSDNWTTFKTIRVREAWNGTTVTVVSASFDPNSKLALASSSQYNCVLIR
ncbi:hypothetical protein AB4254_18735, partial [Vibrio breoganii]